MRSVSTTIDHRVTGRVLAMTVFTKLKPGMKLPNTLWVTPLTERPCACPNQKNR